jgi:hypothetical protein
MVAECLLPPVLLDAFQMYVLFVSSVVAVDVKGELEIKFKINVIMNILHSWPVAEINSCQAVLQ